MQFARIWSVGAAPGERCPGGLDKPPLERPGAFVALSSPAHVKAICCMCSGALWILVCLFACRSLTRECQSTPSLACQPFSPVTAGTPVNPLLKGSNGGKSPVTALALPACQPSPPANVGTPVNHFLKGGNGGKSPVIALALSTPAIAGKLVSIFTSANAGTTTLACCVD